MEYLFFLSAMVLIVALCGLLLAPGARRARRNGATPGSARAGAGKPRAPGNTAGQPGARAAPRAPAHSRGGESPGKLGDRDDGLRDALGRWVDSLVVQKRTVEEDPDYRIRTHDSLRALVEDRYGRRVMRRSDSKVNEPPGRSAPSLAERPDDRSVTGVKTPWGW